MQVWDVTQVMAIILEAMFFIYFLWRFYGKIFSKYEPDIQDLDEEMNNVCADITELKAKQNAFHQEIFEYMDGVLQPLNKRMATRLRREEKDLNEPEPSKKRGGMLHLRK